MAKILRFAKLAKQINNHSLFVNGNFDVWQRGLTFNSAGYTADRWFFSSYTFDSVDNDNVAGCSAKKVLSGGSIYNNSYAIELENFVSGYYYSLSQPMITEKVLPHQGEVCTVSYYARSPDLSFQTNLSGCFFYSSLENEIIIGKQLVPDSCSVHSITDTWTKYSHTFNIPANAKTLLFDISPQNNNLAANSRLQLTQMKLETGPQASPLVPNSFLEQLQECESYYQILNHASPIPNNANNFSKTVELRNRLRIPKKSRILQFNDKSRNIASLSFSVKDPYRLLIQGKSTAYNANIDIDSIIIESDIIPIGPPSVPTNVTSLNGIITSGLVIQWSGSADNGSHINYYSVNYGSSPSNLDNNLIIDISGNHPSGTPVSGSISGLLENQRYYFSVSASNGFGSVTSTTYSHYFDEFPNPSAVYNLTGVYNGHVSAHLNWRNNPGSPVPEQYMFQRDTTDQFNSTNLVSILVDNAYKNTRTRYLSNYVFDGEVINYTSAPVYYRVVTILGPESGVSDALLLNRTSPQPPTNITTVALVNSVSVNWIKPSNANGSNITEYAVQYSTNSGAISSGTIVNIKAQAELNSTVISNLTADTEVFFRVASINSIGTGNWSNITSETPNRIPGTPSMPRNLVSKWSDHQTFLNNNWTKSRNLSDFVVVSPYTDPDTNLQYSWPVSIAHIDWDPPTDNGGQHISYYNVQVDTTPSYNSSNYQSYNTYFWRQTSMLMINNMLTANTGTWYIKCAAITPSGTGTYVSGTLSTDRPKALLLDTNSSNNIYEEFEFISRSDGAVDLSQNYYVNSCGLPLLSGYALTGTITSIPNAKTNNNILPRSSNDNFHPFDLIISGLPQNTEFRYQPIWFNAAGSGSLNRPSGSIIWESGRTPVILSEAFKGVRLSLFTVQNKYTTNPIITLRQNQTWTSSMGSPYVSGIMYSGTPSNGGVPIATGITSLSISNGSITVYNPQFRFTSLPYVPYPAWLRVYTVLNVTGTTYTSTPTDLQIWSSVVPPMRPTLTINSSTNNGQITITKSVYSTSTLGADISTFAGSVYLLGYENNAQSVNNNSQVILQASGLLGSSSYRPGSYNIAFKVSNNQYSTTSIVSPISIQSSSHSTNFVFHAATLLLDVTPYNYSGGDIYFDNSWSTSTSNWRNHMLAFFGDSASALLLNLLRTTSVRNYIRWQAGDAGVGSIQLQQGITTQIIVPKIPQHFRGEPYGTTYGKLYSSYVRGIDLLKSDIILKVGSKRVYTASYSSSSYNVPIQRLPSLDFYSSKFQKNVQVYQLNIFPGGRKRILGYGFLY